MKFGELRLRMLSPILSFVARWSGMWKTWSYQCMVAFWTSKSMRLLPPTSMTDINSSLLTQIPKHRIHKEPKQVYQVWQGQIGKDDQPSLWAYCLEMTTCRYSLPLPNRPNTKRSFWFKWSLVFIVNVEQRGKLCVEWYGVDRCIAKIKRRCITNSR